MSRKSRVQPALTIQVDRTPDGVYVPTVCLDDRHLVTLTREGALGYVAGWARAIAEAEFDAAVIAQLTAIGISPEDAVATVVRDLRPDRPPLDDDATAPLRLEPIVSVRTMRGQVAAHLGGEAIMQLDAPEVYHHISVVLPVVMTCDLDAGYRRYAVACLNRPSWQADALVSDLARYRGPETHGADQDRALREEFNAIVRDAHRTRGPRASRLAPTLLPEEVKEALLAYASAVVAVREGHRPPAFAAHIRQLLEGTVRAAGLDPAVVVPPVGASLNPGGRWIPPKKRRK